MQAVVGSTIGGTYSRRTLEREYTSINELWVGCTELKFYLNKDRRRAIAVAPSGYRRGRFDIVADIFLDEKNQEVFREHASHSNISRDVEPVLKNAFHRLTRQRGFVPMSFAAG